MKLDVAGEPAMPDAMPMLMWAAIIKGDPKRGARRGKPWVGTMTRFVGPPYGGEYDDDALR